MSERKYASDYRLEEFVTETGVQSRRVYQGNWYQFSLPEKQLRKAGLRLLATAAGIVAMLLPLLFSSTRIGHTAYVLLPMAFTLIPLYHLFAVGVRLRTYPMRLTRQQRDMTQGRLPGAVIWLCILLGMTSGGAAAYLLGPGLEAGEWLSIGGICAAFVLSLSVLPLRRQAASEQLK